MHEPADEFPRPLPASPARLLFGGLALLGGALLPAAAQESTRLKVWGTVVADSAWNFEAFQKIEAGKWHVSALRQDGSLAIWGANQYGQCRVPALPANVLYADVALGEDYTVALRDDGLIEVFGYTSSQLADVPPLPPGLSYVQVSIAGSSTALALRTDGQIVAWGGFVGSSFAQVPVLPPGLTYTSVDGGGGGAIALRSDGSVVVWGPLLYGQGSVPALPPGTVFVEVSAGERTMLARRSDLVVTQWGELSEPVPALPSGMHYTSVSAGHRFNLALRSDGVIVGWGLDDDALVGIPSGSGFLDVSAGEDCAAALRDDGTPIAWGNNERAQANIPRLQPGQEFVELDGAESVFYSIAALLSDGSALQWGAYVSPLPLPPPPAGSVYVGITRGSGHTLTLTDDGKVAGFGDSGVAVPPPLPPGTVYTSIESGGNFGFALRSDGQAVGWGDNGSGPFDVPPLPPGQSYVEVDVGFGQALARRSDGSAVGWGYNSHGQADIPPLPAGMKYLQLDAKSNVSGALRSDGELLLWGETQYVANVPPPPASSQYVSFRVSSRAALARSSDGALTAWGWASDPVVTDLPALPPGGAWIDFDIGAGPGSVTAGMAIIAEDGSPVTYCTSKPSSLPGCVPVASVPSGYASLSGGPGSFDVHATPVPGGPLVGLAIYSTEGALAAPLNTPFGFLCISASSGLQRAAPGFPAGTVGNCDGAYALDFGAYLQSLMPSLVLVAGTRIDLQVWYRDPPAPGAANLTHALSFGLMP
jgi:alpha-tubulin suppressor-like RCC1 family protein